MHDDDFRWSKIIPHTFIGFVWAIVLAGVLMGGSTLLYKTFAPMQEEARREVFEQTPSYVQGKNTYIARLRLQYEAAEGTQRESLRRLIISEAETIDNENLTESNGTFVESLAQPGGETR